jgi:hypothetical protein
MPNLLDPAGIFPATGYWYAKSYSELIIVAGMRQILRRCISCELSQLPVCTSPREGSASQVRTTTSALSP